MKTSYLLLAGLLSIFCSSSDWDSGAQKQEAQDTVRDNSLQENTNNQFPSTQPQTNEAQPF